jgi:hypothetical protein
MLEALPFVERYAWFELQWAAKPWEHVALVNSKTGALTPLGVAYRDARPANSPKPEVSTAPALHPDKEATPALL